MPIDILYYSYFIVLLLSYLRYAQILIYSGKFYPRHPDKPYCSSAYLWEEGLILTMALIKTCCGATFSMFNVALVQIEKALGELYSSFSDNIKRYKTGSHWSKQHKPSVKISLRLTNFKFYFTIHPSQLIIILKVIEMLRWRAF